MFPTKPTSLTRALCLSTHLRSHNEKVVIHKQRALPRTLFPTKPTSLTRALCLSTHLRSRNEKIVIHKQRALPNTVTPVPLPSFYLCSFLTRCGGYRNRVRYNIDIGIEFDTISILSSSPMRYRYRSCSGYRNRFRYDIDLLRGSIRSMRCRYVVDMLVIVVDIDIGVEFDAMPISIRSNQRTIPRFLRQ